ncbi:MAG TPA: polysaccharide biosynthesis C-terminal domain-containing protein [Flavobacteriales bacterium]|nr:polysaccharide biosynthesis C-terminal domain-containing protein [Flavobacteriales bacterium]HMR26872.1 polysaccharide biosynthesis C-terminal domain-containing protein [Flavobacteriales bacterium]
MIRPAIGSVIARAWTTLANLLVIMVAGHLLGAEGLGAISLVVLAITLIQLLNNVVGGGALVHLVPRAPLPSLLRPAYGWAVLTALVAFAVLQLLPLVPDGLSGHVVMLALMQSFYTIHLNVLLGRQRIAAYNRITALHGLVLLVVFAALVRMPGGASVLSYVQASYAAFATTLGLSAWALVQRAPGPAMPSVDGLLRRMVTQGLHVQGANAMQLLNYRFAYYLIEHFQGLAALGVYSVATQLAEGAWLVPRSLGMVLYSAVSNERAPDRQRALTLTVFKASVAAATGALLVALLLPDAVYALLFGAEVHGVRPLLACLAPGIVAMAASQAYSHYFSGVGRNVHNAVGSGLGLVVTIGAGLVLVPTWGTAGAALTASLAYAVNAAYQSWRFIGLTGASARDHWPGRADLDRLRRMVVR